MNFFDTSAGQRFLHKQLPDLTTALQDIAAALSKFGETTPWIMDNNLLQDLYYGNLKPIMIKPNAEMRTYDSKASTLEKTLREKLSAFPDTLYTFEQYLLMDNSRDSLAMEQAFTSGFRIAVQMIMSGLIPPYPVTTSPKKQED